MSRVAQDAHRLLDELEIEPRPGDANQYDAIADLFLSSGSAPSKSASSKPAPASPLPKPQPCVLERVIAGHLPVLGSLWIAQYAKSVAAGTHAPVGLIRTSPGELSIELIFPHGAEHGMPRASDSCHSPADALKLGRSIAARWIIRDDDADARSRFDAITLLTGADEAAIVASYRTLKAIGESAPDAPLSIAVMGASDARAADAAERLRHASQTFLSRAVAIAKPVPRISAGSVRTLFSGEAHMPLADVLSALRSPAATSVLPAAHVPESALRIASSRSAPAPSSPAVQAPIAPAPAPAANPQHTPRPAVLEEPPLLASHVPGLTPSRVRCPYAQSVQFAFDSSGTLHLLARDEHETLAASVQALVAAGAWAKMHAELITLAAGIASVPNTQPAMHLFTHRPKDARRLLDADLRCHLLTQAHTAEASTWISVDLN